MHYPQKILSNAAFSAILLFIIITPSCVDLSSGPDDLSNNQIKKIQITSPTSNTLVSEGIVKVFYNVKQPYSTKFLELYINGTFVKNIPPNSDGTLPPVDFKIDSSMIGQKINLYLIYYDNEGTSSKSNTVSDLFVIKDNHIPYKPYNIILLNFNDGSVNISWRDSSKYLEKFEVWRKVDFTGNYILLQELPGNAFNFNDYGLDTNKIYFYKVRGIKESGASEFSDEINTSGLISSGNLFPPSNVTASLRGTSTVFLNWQDNSNNENYFAIERSLLDGPFNRIGIVGRDVTFFKDSSSGLVNGQKYNYRVKSYSNTDSAVSNIVTIIITSNFLIPPSNLVANYNSTVGVVELTWINNDNKILFIDIERKMLGGSYTLIRRINASNNIYLDFNVMPGQTYFYRIRGFDLNSYSGYSNEATISTQ